MSAVKNKYSDKQNIYSSLEEQYSKKCIHELFEQQVKRLPDAIALVYEQQQLSYNQLNSRSNQLAHYLLSQGVGPESRVGICLNRSLEMIVGILGILKSGACYVPLDPEYPKSRLHYIQKDSGVNFLISQRCLQGLLAIDSIIIDSEWESKVSHFPATNINGYTHPSNLAYIIYTSGSTGNPKGVGIQHESTVSLLTWSINVFDQYDIQAVLASTSMCFDLSVFEIFLPLCNGKECILIDDILSIDRLPQKYRVTLINTVPSAIKALLSQNAIPENVRVINLAGERLTTELVDQLYALTTVVSVNDLYGPSEATTYCTYVRRSAKGDETIGLPIANTSLYILDKNKVVTTGVEGELYIGGAGLARGYLKRPSLTAEKFIPNPFSNIPGSRMYQTGDLVRELADTNIQYISRIDQQVKIRGYRIELGEIENVISSHTEVKDVVVTCHDNGRENTQLVAYIVADKTPNKKTKKASDFCVTDDIKTNSHIDEWMQVYDQDIYRETVRRDVACEAKDCFDGWLNSYDRSAISLQEMQAWASQTVERIKESSPENILEIGCGVGLLLHRLLPDCKTYVGSDFSRNAIEHLHSNIPLEKQSHVKLHCCEAKDFSAYNGRTFDSIVINSVIQCFPDIDYFLETIAACLEHVNSGGTVFIGDVRNYDLLGTFATSIELNKNTNVKNLDDMRVAINSRVAKEDELLVSPIFFQQLKSVFPAISHIAILPKYDISNSGFDNELFRYRYDVVLYVNATYVSRDTDLYWLDWRHSDFSEDLFRKELSVGRETISLKYIQDTRLQYDLNIYSALCNNTDATQSTLLNDILCECEKNHLVLPIESYIKIAREFGYEVKASLLDTSVGEYNLHMSLPQLETSHELLSLQAEKIDFTLLASDPMRVRKDADLKQKLRDYLKECLPEYMIPSAFIVLTELPLTINGKIDRKLLPVPDSTSFVHEKYISPQTDNENILVTIWERVLNVSPIGLADNFFSLGGDSISSIHVVSQAKAQGFNLSTKAIFEYPTIKSLALKMESQLREVSQTRSSGTLALLPMQRLFLRHSEGHNNRYSMSKLFTVPEKFTVKFLKKYLTSVYEKHDVFRLRFSSINKQWHAAYYPITQQQIEESIIEKSLCGLSDDKRLETIVGFEQSIKKGIDIVCGPLLKLVYFRAEDSKQSRLLFVIHHLIGDAISWKILLNDLDVAFNQWQNKSTIVLPIKTHSFQVWSQALVKYSCSENLQTQKDYWISKNSREIPVLPIDNLNKLTADYISNSCISFKLNPVHTTQLINHCHDAYNTQVNDLFLSGLFLAVYKWTGQQALCVNLMGHGREGVFNDIDVSQTVGCFNSIFPLTMHLTKNWSASKGDLFFSLLIKTIKEELRAVPIQGFDFGLMQYLLKDKSFIDSVSDNHSDIYFNYLGNFDEYFTDTKFFACVDELTGANVRELLPHSHKLSINARVKDGQVIVDIDFNSDLYTSKTIEKFSDLFLQSLIEIINHCNEQICTRYTPCDFPLVQLKQEDVDLLQARYPLLLDCYCTTDLQSGLIFHSLFDQKEYSEDYIVQVYLAIEQEIDIKRFKQVWCFIASRYDCFRTAFYGFDREQILQVVVSNVELSWVEMDWRDKSADELSAAFNEYCCFDRHQCFDLTTAPLIRFTLIREKDNSYRFLWTYHHSILDGWSLAIVLKEMVSCYGDTTCLKNFALPKTVAYKEYLIWLKAQDKDAARRFWQTELGQIESKTDIGLKHSSVNCVRGENRVKIHTLSSKQTQLIEAFARRYQVTTNTIIVASWAYLLSCYSASDTVVLGQTVSGRDGSIINVESMVGLLIHTIPVSVNVAGNLSIQKWLRLIHHQSVKREKYSHLSLIDIQKCSGVPLTESMFESLIAFVNYPMDGAEFEYENTSKEKTQNNTINNSKKLTSETLSTSMIGSNESTNYDLSLIVIPSNQLTFKLNYRAEYFSTASIERLLTHLFTVLDTIVSDKCTLVSELELLSDKERHQLLFEMNDNKASYPSNKCVHSLFEDNEMIYPDTIVLVQKNLQLSYRELNRRANQLAHYLIAQGVGPDVRVVVYLEQSINSIICLLGILKAGGVYVPVDSNYSKNRIHYVIGDSEACYILTQLSLFDVLGFNEHNVLCIDSEKDRASVNQYPYNNPIAAQNGLIAQNLAYIIYTSGSTGQPKGVMQTHQTLVNLVYTQCQDPILNLSHTTLQLASIAFDVAMQEISTAWFTNSKLVLVAENTKLDTVLLWDWIEQQHIERIFISPVLAYQVFQHKRKYKHIKEIVCAGEQLKLTEGLAEYFKVNNSYLLNHYGPTETHVTAGFKLAKGSTGYCPPIGQALNNHSLYILSNTMNLVPMGVCGELYISGQGLARGYNKKAKSTAEKFVPHPFSQKPGERLYRTGDLVRYLADGNLEFIGRIDYQVKVRGFRIELGEIESVLLQHKQVENVVVVAKEDGFHNTHLLAYVIGKDTVDSNQLHSHCQAQLPTYMIPSTIIVVDSLPLTVNGKVNTSALPIPNLSTQQINYEPAQGKTEELLAALCCDVLTCDRVGRLDNFFELGAHSLSIMQLVTQIQTHCFIRLAVADVFKHPTVMELSLLVEKINNLKNNGVIESLTEEEAEILLQQLENN